MLSICNRLARGLLIVRGRDGLLFSRLLFAADCAMKHSSCERGIVCNQTCNNSKPVTYTLHKPQASDQCYKADTGHQ
jgi:hypothetical protein